MYNPLSYYNSQATGRKPITITMDKFYTVTEDLMITCRGFKTQHLVPYAPEYI
jgi:hypothetical protein